MGYSLEEITGKHHSLFVSAADRDSAAYREFWPALARGEGRQGQQLRIRKDGSSVWLSTRYTPILGLDGKPFKVVKHCYDVTDRRAEQVMNAAYKGALSNLAANVMVADIEGRIVLVNGAVVALLSEAETDIRREVAGFSASALHGRQLGNENLSQRTEEQASSAGGDREFDGGDDLDGEAERRQRGRRTSWRRARAQAEKGGDGGGSKAVQRWGRSTPPRAARSPTSSA
jgi:PAS domain S-box-containing protein